MAVGGSPSPVLSAPGRAQNALSRKGRGQIRALDLLATAIALLLAVPILSVIASLLGDTATLRHLAATVLPEYIANTLGLGALVIAGVLLIGVPTAWLTASC